MTTPCKAGTSGSGSQSNMICFYYPSWFFEDPDPQNSSAYAWKFAEESPSLSSARGYAYSHFFEVSISQKKA